MAAPEASIIPQLEEAVSKVRKDIESIRNRAHLGEASTQMFLILPLIKALGWKELEHITLEHQIAGGDIVDIALVVEQKPVIFVESKRLIRELSPKEAKQVLGYAAAGGVRWCLLTNGQQYQLYDRSLEVELPGNLVFSVDLLEANDEEIIAKLGLLSLHAVTSRQLERTAAKWYILSHLLGWMKEGDEKLIQLVKKRFPDKAGAILKNGDVAEILALLSEGSLLLPFDGTSPKPPPKAEPPILYTGWRLDGEMLYVTKTNKQDTKQWEEKLPLEEFEKL
ncbi:MAG: type I restriction enzyme HsdR N-terminal domain-containing protein, partial [Armatimonadetes bacterium]|nr:type I restriction enzyme HsdR N-terminal domain-containing protein [Armatimonadota bacterium]